MVDFNEVESYQHMMGENTDYSNHVESPAEAIRDRKIDMDVREKNAGTRFHDSGERIPGRQKGLNDANLDRPAMLYPLGPGR